MTSVANSPVVIDSPGSSEAVYATLARVCGVLEVSMDRSQLVLADLPHDHEDHVTLLAAAGKHVGLTFKEFDVEGLDEIWELVTEGYPVVLVSKEINYVVEWRIGGRLQCSRVSKESGVFQVETISRRQLAKTISQFAPVRAFAVKEELECSHLAGSEQPDGHGHAGHGHAGHGRGAHGDAHGRHGHQTPLRRFIGLLRMDRRDVGTITIFALVGGILSLAVPLAIESLVNVVSWGTYWQPLVVLAMILLGCLGISGVLRVLQTCLAEIVQRRQFVRIIGDLAHRFPRANRQALQHEYPRELANRLFEVVTIQKATAVLLLDGLTLALTALMGMLLLAFYHPFLLGFDIILLFLMVTITWSLGGGGIRTAIEESIMKYRTIHWLQDVIDSPTAFKVNGGESLAIDRANRLCSDYLRARERQFRIVIRQVAFAIGMQVIASTVLLGLGGWLVMKGQLTLGQLVASELVVAVIVGSFAKAGKSLEMFYDVMASMEKVGHMFDVPVDARHEQEEWVQHEGEVTWDDLEIEGASGSIHVPSVRIPARSRVAIVGDDEHAKSLLLRVLAGLQRPLHGTAEIAGVDARYAGISAGGRIVGYAGTKEVFHASLIENVSLGRHGVGRNRVRETLQSLGIWNEVLRLPDGATTRLQTGGYPLNPTQIAVLMIARAIAGNPTVLLIDKLLDELPDELFEQVWEAVTNPDAPWTLLVATSDERVTRRMSDRVSIRHD